MRGGVREEGRDESEKEEGEEREGDAVIASIRRSASSSGVARILCQGAQVWRREKTENNKCMTYHPRQHCILLSMRYCIGPVCHSHTIIK